MDNPPEKGFIKKCQFLFESKKNIEIYQKSLTENF